MSEDRTTSASTDLAQALETASVGQLLAALRGRGALVSAIQLQATDLPNFGRADAVAEAAAEHAWAIETAMRKAGIAALSESVAQVARRKAREAADGFLLYLNCTTEGDVTRWADFERMTEIAKERMQPALLQGRRVSMASVAWGKDIEDSQSVAAALMRGPAALAAWLQSKGFAVDATTTLVVPEVRSVSGKTPVHGPTTISVVVLAPNEALLEAAVPAADAPDTSDAALEAEPPDEGTELAPPREAA